jgi:putative tryptophan/tyrosine transport system substrate-binding protein
MTKMLAFVVIALIVSASQPAGAQKPATIARIGYLVLASGLSTNFEAFRGGLHDLGYVEGQTIAIEYRSAESASRLIEQARDLVRLKVDVIVAQGGAAIVPAKGDTNVIPIVFGHSADPVEAGFIHSLARPGGNMTGMTFLSYELSGKRLELLREAVPKASRVAVVANPSHPGEQRELSEVRTTARNLGATVQYLQTKTSSDFDSAFEAILREQANALLVFPDAVTLGSRSRIAEFATTSRLPSIFGWKELC